MAIPNKNCLLGTSLAVQWLRLCAPTAGDTGSIAGREAKILHAVRPKKQKQTNKKICLLGHRTCPAQDSFGSTEEWFAGWLRGTPQ